MTNHEKRIERAEEYLRRVSPPVAHAPYRQKWHFMPPAGWMNDPNGLIQFNGEFHVFYQFNPYAPVWGAMHWGHATSTDLVHWRHLPVALAPSEPYDDSERGGCFSGSAVDDAGVLTLMYTATAQRDGGFVQTQCMARSRDGIRFRKDPANPVIAQPPRDGSRDFRDPKMWRHDGSWYVVIGSSKDGQGKALLYRSNDLSRWDYVGVLVESRNDFGSMWECPDCFPLGDKHVLLFSPMGMGDRKCVYFVGDLDYRTGAFHREAEGEVDWGFEYYAPQSFLDARGRRLIMGWQNAWDWMPWWKDFGPTSTEGWCGSLALPRTVELDPKGRLRFLPAQELAALRRRPLEIAGLALDGEEKRVDVPDGRSFELRVEFDLTRTSADRFGLRLRSSRDRETLLCFERKGGQLVFDRRRSGYHAEGVRRCSVDLTAETVVLHVFVDTCSVEAFTDGGRTWMSNNIYPDPGDTGVSVVSSGQAIARRLQYWELAG